MARLKNPFNSLLGKLLLGFWLTSTLTLSIVVGLPSWQKARDQQQVILPSLKLVLERSAERLDRYPNLELRRLNQGLPRFANELGNNLRELEGLKLFLVDGNGNPVAEGNNRHLPRPLREFLLDFNPDQPMRQQQFGNMLVFGLQPLNDGHYLIGKVDDVPRPWLFELLQRPWLFILLSTVISTIVFGVLAWTFSIPLQRLRATSSAIAQGELQARVAPEIAQRGDEIGQLGSSFNHMADSVAAMIASQQRLLSDISHELRTPLTRLKLSLAIAARKGQHSDELTRIETEADQLEAMLQELLTLSRLNLQSTDRKTELNLHCCWQPVLAGAQFEANEMGKQLSVYGETDMPFIGIESLLQRLLENPLRNALRYAAQAVTVRFVVQPTMIEIVIEDDGVGVPEPELAQIFKPFHRVDDARDRHSGGWGLGLAITQAAVEAHQGTLTASNRASGGLAIHIKLPRT